MPRFIVTFIILFIFGTVSAGTKAPQKILDLTKRFHSTMVSCPEKTWPGYSWSQRQVLLIDSPEKQAWLWNADSNSLEQINYSILTPPFLNSPYRFAKVRGLVTVSLLLENMEEAFAIGVHEVFHIVGQENWPRTAHNEMPASEYPTRWTPRFYRAMILKNLEQYFVSENTQHLSHAKYWFEKWRTEFPKEVLLSSDNYEGTAKYVETMAKIISSSGCSISEKQLKKMAQKEVEINKLGSVDRAEQYGLFDEGYFVGGMSTLILRFQNPNFNDLANRLAKGVSPLEILMESAVAQEEAGPLELVNKIQKQADDLNSQQAKTLDAPINAWPNTKDYTRVGISSQWLQGNLQPLSFSYSARIDKVLVSLYNDHHFISKTKKSDFILPANGVFFHHKSERCPSADFYIVVPSSSLSIAGGGVVTSDPQIQGTISGDLVIDRQGIRTLCLQ